MGKSESKSEKKDHKKRKEEKEGSDGVIGDVSMAVTDVNMDEERPLKKAKKEKDDVVINPEDLSPLAQPLAQKKLLKKLHKTIKKRQVKRGVKEVVKGIRKGEKGLLVLAADITPMDIISHLPVLSEEAQIPYVFIPSKEELGHASSTKRPTSCVMVCPDSKKQKRKDGEAEDKDDDYREFMAAGAKTKTNGTAANGAAPKNKPAKVIAPSPTASGTVTHSVEDSARKGAEAPRSSRPDKASYDAEQEALKSKITELQEKMSAVQNKINAGSNAGPGAERRAQLRAEWDKIRQDQGKFKNSRSQIMTQLKSINEGISKKIKDLQAAKSKTQFKSVAEVDAHIKQLEKQVESGSMKLVEEKRALQEISQCKRLRRTVESFEADQESIERDRATVDELRKQLDDPEARAVSEHADGVKAELDQLKKDSDEAYANRNKLFDERNDLKAQVDELYRQKRESMSKYKEDNDRYWTKVNEDRARRTEKARAQRLAEEEAKKKETALRLREEAEMPAYQSQIEDCQTLIEYLSGKSSGPMKLSTSIDPVAAARKLAGVPKLDLRQVDGDVDGLVVRKKKGDNNEAYFIGGKGKKGKRSSAKTTPVPAAEGDATPVPSFTGALNMPLPTLAALLSLSIPPPASAVDVPRAIEDLKTKKAWFEANQARVTAENVAKAEANISKLMNGSKTDVSPDTPSNGSGEKPAEPTSTPATQNGPAAGISASDVDEQMEAEIQEETVAVA
ncbi:hypothetical protein EW145_g449 [Phellinidium pouzarii]|uniref:Ribosomal protein eL8/eL30/eS12/Gadd45 domain-containing protein n=1 Tax=Phellinidium pouzarii TaxID=167371 RepID=A0A4S4LK35_9AGAM|nr:hypothetical protein EW145_g449 [Phellinidium pouzarii]